MKPTINHGIEADLPLNQCQYQGSKYQGSTNASTNADTFGS